MADSWLKLEQLLSSKVTGEQLGLLIFYARLNFLKPQKHEASLLETWSNYSFAAAVVVTDSILVQPQNGWKREGITC